MSSAQRVGMKSRNDQFVVVINNGNRNDQPDAEYGNHCFAACLSGIMFPPLGFILALATDNKKHRLAFLNGGIATICFLSFAATLVGVFVPMSNNCDTTNDCKATAWLDSQSNNRLDHLTGCAFPAVVAAAASYLKSRGYTSNMSSNPCSSCDSCYASYNKWYLALYIGAPFLLISFCTLVVVGIIASRKYSNKSVTTLQVSDQNVPGQMITKTDTNQQPADAIMRSDMYSEDNRSTYRAEPTKINDIVTSYPPSYLMSSEQPHEMYDSLETLAATLDAPELLHISERGGTTFDILSLSFRQASEKFRISAEAYLKLKKYRASKTRSGG